MKKAPKAAALASSSRRRSSRSTMPPHRNAAGWRFEVLRDLSDIAEMAIKARSRCPRIETSRNLEIVSTEGAGLHDLRSQSAG